MRQRRPATRPVVQRRRAMLRLRDDGMRLYAELGDAHHATMWWQATNVIVQRRASATPAELAHWSARLDDIRRAAAIIASIGR